MRASHDAIMVGTGTVVADNPQLTCRLPGLSQQSPVRVVIDRHLRVPPTTRLVAEARRVPTWVLALRSADPGRRAAFLDSGVTLIDVGCDAEGQIDLAAALVALGERGITRLLVEGGARLAAALFRAGLIDRLAWVHAPLLIGGDGIPAIGGFGLAELADAPGLERVSMETVGADVLTIFRVRK
jgi:diaminohydroxyphosphoribosylaminopyrimidine deaminase/5-amino-6-(5-phosphoribosylamino)uracil reductase